MWFKTAWFDRGNVLIDALQLEKVQLLFKCLSDFVSAGSHHGTSSFEYLESKRYISW